MLDVEIKPTIQGRVLKTELELNWILQDILIKK